MRCQSIDHFLHAVNETLIRHPMSLEATFRGRPVSRSEKCGEPRDARYRGGVRLPCRIIRCMFCHQDVFGLLTINTMKFSDVNAFLTLAATRHTLPPEELKGNPRADEIVTAARAGRVTVRLVSSEWHLIPSYLPDTHLVTLSLKISRRRILCKHCLMTPRLSLS